MTPYTLFLVAFLALCIIAHASDATFRGQPELGIPRRLPLERTAPPSSISAIIASTQDRVSATVAQLSPDDAVLTDAAVVTLLSGINGALSDATTSLSKVTISSGKNEPSESLDPDQTAEARLARAVASLLYTVVLPTKSMLSSGVQSAALGGTSPVLGAFLVAVENAVPGISAYLRPLLRPLDPIFQALHVKTP